MAYVMSPIIMSDSPTPFVPSITTIPGYTLVNGVLTKMSSPIGVIQTPIITPPLPMSLNVNENPDTWHMMSKHYYYKTLDAWLWEEDSFKDLLNYLQVTSHGVDVLNNMKDYRETNISKDTQETYEMKVNFIEHNVFSIESMLRLLKKFVRETGMNWVDLSKNSYFVKDLIKKYLKQKLQAMIDSKMSK